MQTVFITGATGFIGSHLVDWYRDRGHAVRCLVRSPDRALRLQRDGVETVAGTLENVADWGGALAGCGTVISAGGTVASRRRGDFAAVNGRAVGDLADACSRIGTPPTLVHISSLAAAGPAPGPTPLDESLPPAPVSRYGASKLVGERELRLRADRLPITVVRPGIVFGPRDELVAAAFQSIDRIRLHVRMGFRDAPLSLLHVADLVPLLTAAADRGERLVAGPALTGQGIYNACDDREHPTYGDLGRRIAAALGRSVLVVPLPVALAWPASLAVQAFWNALGQPSIVSPDKLREATAGSWAASAAKARRDLGFTAAAALDDRLRETAAWLRSNCKLLETS
ncbi:NAD-dependent epimerase [Planctomycetia bacterium]|nr:NAD-dependent epimerase [Planctomycetia bacterium]